MNNKYTDKDIFIGQLAGDGIVMCTPMGSMSRGMSLNGPLMHKEMENIMIIPICPLSLKFRPLCLPA
jgi:NAD kinase